MAAEQTKPQYIGIERHGDIAVIIPSPEVEKLPENLMEQAAQMVLAPLRTDPPAGLIFDLSKVDYVGSVFLSFLLRRHSCRQGARQRGGGGRRLQPRPRVAAHDGPRHALAALRQPQRGHGGADW